MGFSRVLTYGGVGTVSLIAGAQLNQIVRPSSPEDKEWDNNWDGREKQECHATRNLLLIRHGNYLIDAPVRDEKKLTDLGIQQLHETGKYLKALGLKYTKITHSTLIRAVESCDIIMKYLPADLPKSCDEDLCEGLPYVPIPWRSNLNLAKDNERIERAFKTHFHRADPDQKKNSHEIIVCHANVIRYFVCRVLQLPPSAWLRMSLFHGSVTSVSIRPNGHVSVNSVGDIGFMPRKLQTR